MEVSEKLASRLHLKERPESVVADPPGRNEFSLEGQPLQEEESTLFVPFHWGGEQSVNLLTQETLDPVSRMPELKVCAAQLTQEEEPT